MAEEKGKKLSNNGKGAAFAKRAKIDSAQKNMLIVVCIASIILGVTIVASIYLIKKISFNTVKITENGKVIENLKVTQKNLDELYTHVSNLTTNDNLEVVANKLEGRCTKDVVKTISEEVEKNIGLVRTCSALRVIPDTLPSTINSSLKDKQYASNSSINWLLIHDYKSLGILGISSDDSNSQAQLVDENGQTLNLKKLGTAVNLEDTATRVNRAISTIENSIRNFDISSVSIRWSDTQRGRSSGNSVIEFSAIYNSYYSEEKTIVSNKTIICADNTSESCAKKKGSGTVNR